MKYACQIRMTGLKLSPSNPFNMLPMRMSVHVHAPTRMWEKKGILPSLLKSYTFCCQVRRYNNVVWRMGKGGRCEENKDCSLCFKKTQNRPSIFLPIKQSIFYPLSSSSFQSPHTYDTGKHLHLCMDGDIVWTWAFWLVHKWNRTMDT